MSLIGLNLGYCTNTSNHIPARTFRGQSVDTMDVWVTVALGLAGTSIILDLVGIVVNQWASVFQNFGCTYIGLWKWCARQICVDLPDLLISM